MNRGLQTPAKVTNAVLLPQQVQEGEIQLVCAIFRIVERGREGPKTNIMRTCDLELKPQIFSNGFIVFPSIVNVDLSA